MISEQSTKEEKIYHLSLLLERIKQRYPNEVATIKASCSIPEHLAIDQSSYCLGFIEAIEAMDDLNENLTNPVAIKKALTILIAVYADKYLNLVNTDQGVLN